MSCQEPAQLVSMADVSDSLTWHNVQATSLEKWRMKCILWLIVSVLRCMSAKRSQLPRCVIKVIKVIRNSRRHDSRALSVTEKKIHIYTNNTQDTRKSHQLDVNASGTKLTSVVFQSTRCTDLVPLKESARAVWGLVTTPQAMVLVLSCCKARSEAK